MAPKELCIFIRHDRGVFWNIWWGVTRLRGLPCIFRLNDCTAFRLYEVRDHTWIFRSISWYWKCPKQDSGNEESKKFHKQLICNQQDLNTLAAFRRSWGLSRRLSSLFGSSLGYERAWRDWIHKYFNYCQYEPDNRGDSKNLSLETVLGWSPLRIAIVVLGPFLLSLAISLWFQSKI